jgi:hypothetical protein
MNALIRSQFFPVIYLVLFSTALNWPLGARASAPDFYTIDEKLMPPSLYDHSFTANGNGSGVAREVGSANETSTGATSLDPIATFTELARDFAAQSQAFVSLIHWDHHRTTLEDPSEPYNRLRDFGSWVINHAHSSCLDTRGEVLARSSRIPVTYLPGGCRVTSGQWLDLYANKIVTVANDLDIDHVVPLKNAYLSGGWKWTPQRRCLYANYMGNNFHLLAVNKGDNRQKGQNGPDAFMPENVAFRCAYLAIWLKIKLIWNLALPPDEAAAVATLLKENNCELARMNMPADELQNQRRIISSQREICSAL